MTKRLGLNFFIIFEVLFFIITFAALINSFIPLKIELYIKVTNYISKHPNVFLFILLLCLLILLIMVKKIYDNKEILFYNQDQIESDKSLIKKITNIFNPDEIIDSLENTISNKTLDSNLFIFIYRFPRGSKNPLNCFNSKKLEKLRHKMEEDLNLLVFLLMSNIRQTNYEVKIEDGDFRNENEYKHLLQQLEMDERIRKRVDDPSKISLSLKSNYRDLLELSRKILRY